MAHRTINGTVFGRVQGVGFRDFTLKKALSLSVVGWVKNQDDGSVTFVAQGENDAIEILLESLKVGPQYARVDNLEVYPYRQDENWDTFKIVF